MQAPLAGQLDDSFKGSRIKYEPVGVVLGITPWNFPLSERGGGGELSCGMTSVNDASPRKWSARDLICWDAGGTHSRCLHSHGLHWVNTGLPPCPSVQ